MGTYQRICTNFGLICFSINLLGCTLLTDGMSVTGNRESRKLFGGYKITPKFCNASKTLPANDPRSHGPTICMFNHECTQRHGEVVGACMDGFLFGTCCQLHGSVETPLKPDQNQQQPSHISSARPGTAQLYEKYGSQLSTNDAAASSDNGGYYNNDDDLLSNYHPSSSEEYITASSSSPSSSSEYYDYDINAENSTKQLNPNQHNIIITHNSVSGSTPSAENLLFDEKHDQFSSYFPHPTSTSGSVTKGEMYLPPDIGASQTYSPELPTLLSDYGPYSDEDISISTEKNHDFTAAGISQITNTLLQDDSDIFINPDVRDPNPVLDDSSEEEINSYRPSSPSSSFHHTSEKSSEETTTPRVVKITYGKPQFKPKPTTEHPNKYVLVHTITNENNVTDGLAKPEATISENDIESIESIILMLNGSNAGPQYETHTQKTADGTLPYYDYGLTSPTVKNPTSFYITTKLPSQGSSSKLPTTSYIFSTSPTRRPIESVNFDTKLPMPTSPKLPSTSYLFSTTPPPKRLTTDANKDQDKYTLITSTVNSVKIPSSTLQPPIYSSLSPGSSLSTNSILISSSTYYDKPTSTTTKKPSTSYIFSSTPITKRPATVSDEIIITPTTKKPTGTKRPTTISIKYPAKIGNSTTGATKQPSTSYVTASTPVTRKPTTNKTATSKKPTTAYDSEQSTRPKPTKNTITTTKPAQTSYIYTSQPTKRPSSQPTKTSLSSESSYSPSSTSAPPSTYEYEYPPSYISNNNINRPDYNDGYVQLSTIGLRPNPTIHITPKPSISIQTTASWTNRPPLNNQFNDGEQPSNQFVYTALPTISPHPGSFYSTTPIYPPISNDFDDSGYFGVTVRPTIEHTVTQTSIYNVIEQNPILNSYGQPIPGQNHIGSSTYHPISSSTYQGYPISGSPIIYQSTPLYPTFNDGSIKDQYQTSPNDLVNFPPVRNPNLNISNYDQSVEQSTPEFIENEVLDDKMGVLVSKIVESLQDNFDTLADMVYDRNESMIEIEELGDKPVKKPTSTVKPLGTKKPTTKPTKKTTVAQDSPVKQTTKRPVTRLTTKSTVTTRKPTKKTTVSTKRPTTKPTKKITTPTTAAIEDDEYEDEEEDVGQQVETEEQTHYQGKLQCGVRPQVKSGRIVGGKSSAFGEWPWQVLVRESTWLGLFTKNKCGGVLITNNYVMTAAHCQPGFLASLVAVFGEYDISGELETKRSVTKNVKNIIVHRQYDAATFENDLALLQLESPIHYDTHIVPICMPPDEQDFTGRMATVTGWGRLKYGGGVPSVLQEVQVPIIENKDCQEMFITAGHEKKILPSFLCAGYANGQKDSCEGDSGGPLVLQRPDGRWELAGTVSHGIKCAAPYLPGVYMRTTFYKPWLQTVTGVH